LLLLLQELIEAESVDRLDLLSEYLVNWVATFVEQVDQVLEFLLTQLEVQHLIVHLIDALIQFKILLHQCVHVFKQLRVLEPNVVAFARLRAVVFHLLFCNVIENLVTHHEIVVCC